MPTVTAQTPSALTNAQSPFNQPSADITLRTCDHVDFHVHSQILSQASPVFATMFHLPQPKLPTAVKIPTRPVVDVTEDGTTLDALLRLCYPIKSPTLGSAEAIEPVLKAVLKYDMEWVAEGLTRSLLELVPSSPLRLWAIGCRMKLEEVAQRGAEAMFKSLPEGERGELRTLPGISQPSADLEGVSVGDHFRCLSYINRRRAGQEPLSPLLTYSESLRQRSLRRVPEQQAAAALMAELPFQNFPPLDPASDVPHPDIICMSSEGDGLRAHRCILSFHSPVLRKRILALQVASSEPSTLLTLKTTQRLETLHYLLDLCYMNEDHLPYDIYTLTKILQAARSYQMKHIIRIVESRWYVAAKENPYDAYVFADDADVHKYARTAARLAVDTVDSPHNMYAIYFNTLPARTCHRLLVYHDACRNAIREEFRSAKDRWEKMATDIVKHPFMGPSSALRISDYLVELEANFKDKPAVYLQCMREVFGPSPKSSTSTAPWGHGIRKVPHELCEFARTLPQKIEDIVDRESMPSSSFNLKPDENARRHQALRWKKARRSYSATPGEGFAFGPLQHTKSTLRMLR
ncbi:hypothetical protein L226DRAFT_572390 [Lentinus tigrinus ALCF2SS1-7]|nr:hypothetical protein L226DRAFT_572390 [Lentinus tigrinus ALCF2SS1-7]